MTQFVRFTPDGFVVRTLTTTGVPVELTVTGLNDVDTDPLVIEVRCQKCRETISKREYAPGEGPPPPGELIDHHAVDDAMKGNAHQCASS